MPSSLIIVALVVAWLVVLVPMIVRKRQEIARTADSALAARVVRSAEDVEEAPMRDTAPVSDTPDTPDDPVGADHARSYRDAESAARSAGYDDATGFTPDSAAEPRPYRSGADPEQHSYRADFDPETGWPHAHHPGFGAETGDPAVHRSYPRDFDPETGADRSYHRGFDGETGGSDRGFGPETDGTGEHRSADAGFDAESGRAGEHHPYHSGFDPETGADRSYHPGFDGETDGSDRGFDPETGDPVAYRPGPAADRPGPAADLTGPRPYRPGRGGFDPEAAAIIARAKYAFRQRVVLTMIVAAIVLAVFAAVVFPLLWWPHGVVDITLISYLAYLRRQVRIEQEIRERRLARLRSAARIQAHQRPLPVATPAPRPAPPPPPPPVPHATLLDPDDEDPAFDELDHPDNLPYRRAAGE